MPKAVIAAASRTRIGRAKKGSFVDVRPDDLAAFAVKDVVAKVPEIDPGEIVDVMLGCGFPEQRQGMNIARRAALLAGLPSHVPGTTVNRFCASSLQTIRMAFHAIKAGEGDVFVAGGVESVSQINGYPKELGGDPPSALRRRRRDCQRLHPDGDDRGERGSGVRSQRRELDRFAQRSQERAVAAQESGFFAKEFSAYTKEDGRMVASDDGPRPSSTLEKLAQLEAASRPDEVVTAGNSCPLNDGAAAVVVMSDERAG